MKRYEDAVHAYGRAIAIDPNDVYAWSCKGNALCEIKRYEDAKRRPQPLEQKINLIRECFSAIPELKSFSADGDALLTKFSVAGKKRNDIVHGAIASLSIEDGSFRFLKVDVSPKEHHSVREVLLEDSDWKNFRKELLSLGRDGQHLAQKICLSTNQGRN